MVKRFLSERADSYWSLCSFGSLSCPLLPYLQVLNPTIPDVFINVLGALALVLLTSQETLYY